MKAILKKIGKAIWKALPWAFLTIWLTCIFSFPILHANERADLNSQISALEAENAMHESVNARLVEDIEWLRSLAVQDTEVTP